MSETENIQKPELPTTLDALLTLARDNEGGFKQLNETDFAMIWTAIFGVGVWYALPYDLSFGIVVAMSGVGAWGTAGMMALAGFSGILILTMLSVIGAAVLAGTANQSINLLNFLKMDGLSSHRETIMKSLWHEYYKQGSNDEFIFVSPQQKYPGIIIPIEGINSKNKDKVINEKNENDEEPKFEIEPTRKECQKEPEWYKKQIEELKNKYRTNFESTRKLLKSLTETESSNKNYCVVLTNNQIDTILNHSFFDTVLFSELFNTITNLSKDICNTTQDGILSMGQDFSYKVIKEENNLTYLTGPVCIGNLKSLSESGDILPYKDDKSPVVYLKENGWFTSCSNDGNHINCNPLKIKTDSKCWTVSTKNKKLEDNKLELIGFNFLSLTAAVEHDSYIASSCFYEELQNDFTGLQNTVNDYFAGIQSKPKDQSGGNLNSFNKYIKYKNKYFELKNSLKM